MTLIAAFRCQGGMVFAADSQETITDEFGNEYRKTVQKIAPRKIGNYEVALAGAGHSALIEAFILHFEEAIASNPSLTGIKTFRRCAENQLRQFYENDVRLCPDENKHFALFIAVTSTSTQEFEGWITEQTRLRPIAHDRPELIGVEYGLFTQTAHRLFVKDMLMSQAILASIYVLNLAEQSSNWVRGPMSVVAIKGNGIWEERPEHIKQMQDRLGEYEQQINAMFLACADTSITAFALEDVISNFSQVAVRLHRQHIDAIVGRLTINDLRTTNAPYPKIPLGSIVTFSENKPPQIEHDRERVRIHNEEIRRMMEEGKNWKPRAFTRLTASARIGVDCKSFHCRTYFTTDSMKILESQFPIIGFDLLPLEKQQELLTQSGYKEIAEYKKAAMQKDVNLTCPHCGETHEYAYEDIRLAPDEEEPRYH